MRMMRTCRTTLRRESGLQKACKRTVRSILLPLILLTRFPETKGWIWRVGPQMAMSEEEMKEWEDECRFDHHSAEVKED
jgi:hypothetical protein